MFPALDEQRFPEVPTDQRGIEEGSILDSFLSLTRGSQTTGSDLAFCWFSLNDVRDDLSLRLSIVLPAEPGIES